MTATDALTATIINADEPHRMGVASWLLFTTLHTPGALWGMGVSMLLAIICMLAAIMADLRWMMVAMMILLLILPMIVAFLFFVYGLKNINCLNLTLHTEERTPEGLMIYVLLPNKEAVQDEEKVWQTVRTVLIPLSHIRQSIPSARGVWLKIETTEGNQWFFEPDKKTDKRTK